MFLPEAERLVSVNSIDSCFTLEWGVSTTATPCTSLWLTSYTCAVARARHPQSADWAIIYNPTHSFHFSTHHPSHPIDPLPPPDKFSFRQNHPLNFCDHRQTLTSRLWREMVHQDSWSYSCLSGDRFHFFYRVEPVHPLRLQGVYRRCVIGSSWMSTPSHSMMQMKATMRSPNAFI